MITTWPLLFFITAVIVITKSENSLVYRVGRFSHLTLSVVSSLCAYWVYNNNSMHLKRFPNNEYYVHETRHRRQIVIIITFMLPSCRTITLPWITSLYRMSPPGACCIAACHIAVCRFPRRACPCLPRRCATPIHSVYVWYANAPHFSTTVYA